MVNRRSALSVMMFGILGALGVLAMVAAPTSGRVAQTPTHDVAHDDGLQWGFDRIGAADSWSAGRGGGVVVAVVDSGVALEHEDLAGQIVGGTSCRNTGGDPEKCSGSPQDDDGHGTHVAGIIAAEAGNRIGIAGVAPDARIMPIKVLFNSPDCKSDTTCTSMGSPEDVVAAIEWAVDHGADIINLSLGSTVADVFGTEFLLALEQAWDAGVIPVVAAGNSYVQTPDFADAHAVVVAATDRNNKKPRYAHGVGEARWAVAAPGGAEGDTTETCAHGGSPKGILSTFWSPGNDSAYACLSGTSMAAPHVSGALAVLLSTEEITTPAAAVERLIATTTDLGEPGVDEIFGAGLINLAAAVGAAPTTTTTTTTRPTTTTTTPPTSNTPTVPGKTTTTAPTTTTTTTPPATTAAAPVIVDDGGNEEATPLTISEEDTSVGGLLAVGTGVLALGVAVSAVAMRRRGLV